MGAGRQLEAEQAVIWPPTNEQDADAKQAFVDAIDPEAVCRLASRLGGGRPCRIFQAAARGSFNVCFFVEFSTDETTSESIDSADSTDSTNRTRWVVRVPIEPALHDARTKLESEVATMRYVESKTSIPICHVHFYGHDAALGCRPDGAALWCSYLVVDYAAGQPLDLESFLDDTPARQRYLYGQLLDILAQLRQLTFATGGSLMPSRQNRQSRQSRPSRPRGSEREEKKGPEKELEKGGASAPEDPQAVVVGPLQCTGYNELQRLTRGRAAAKKLGTYRTAADFVLAQLRVLQEAFAVPMASATLANLRMEAFALHDLRGRLADVLGGSSCGASGGDDNDGSSAFVLAHTDLRWSNIIVDDRLTVQAVIDWEWSAAVPLLLFLPPTWLAGPSPCYVASLAYEKAYGEFYALLLERASAAAAAAADGPLSASRAIAYRMLADTWDAGLPTRIDLPLAVVLQQHYHLVPAYYFSIFPRFHDITGSRSRHHDSMPPAYVARLLALDADADGPLSRDVHRRWRAACAYRAHLEAAGLLVEYELAGETRAWLARRDAMRALLLEQTLRECADQGRPPTDDRVRMLLESVLQASIQPRNVEPVLGPPVLQLDLLAGLAADASRSGSRDSSRHGRVGLFSEKERLDRMNAM